MTQLEIMARVVAKATANGWEQPGKRFMGIFIDDKTGQQYLLFKGTKHSSPEVELPICGIIFSHQFARSLWGENTHERLVDASQRLKAGSFSCPHCGAPCGAAIKQLREEQPLLGIMQRRFCWQYHLEVMVLADDPLDYLGRNT